MNDARSPHGRANLRTAFVGPRAGSLLEIDAWMPSEVSAISPLVERLMRLIEGSHCVPGEESAVELALREALNNGVVHGNRLDAHKLVHVHCRRKVGTGKGQGFDAHSIPDPLAAESLEAEHGRGIHIMKFAMNEVSFERGGTEVHMFESVARQSKADVRRGSRGFRK